MRDRIATIGPFAAVAAVLGVCCGVPVLLSVGVVGAIAGWSLQSWALIGLGLVLAALGWARMVRGRRDDRSCRPPAAGALLEDATSPSTGSTIGIRTGNATRENDL